MKSSIIYTPLLPLTLAMQSLALTEALSAPNDLHKRDEDGTFSCYTATNIIDFSALCPNINYPITNDKGLSVMGTLYFALASTTVPDDTMYNAQENIICTINGPTGNITTTIGAGLGGGIVNAGAEVSFSLNLPNTSGHSICMFTEGTSSDTKNVTDPITLAQARTLLYTMLTAPGEDCKTCARIPIRYPQTQDGSGQGGGILKVDVTDSNTCLGKCVGPASFTMDSKSAGAQVKPLVGSFEAGTFSLSAAAWTLGFAVFAFALC